MRVDAGLRPPWDSLLRAPPPGAHVILWSDDSPSCEEAMATFLRGGVERNDLCAVVLPEPDLKGLGPALLPRGVDLGELEAEGRVLTATPERLGLWEPTDVDRIPGLLADLRRLAADCRRAGVTVLGRLAPPFYEGRKEEVAASIEECLRDHAGDVRMLCAYRVRSVTQERFAEAVTVVRFHTHAITAIGGGHFFVEPIRPRAEA